MIAPIPVVLMMMRPFVNVTHSRARMYVMFKFFLSILLLHSLACSCFVA
jgi:hypothetical protein